MEGPAYAESQQGRAESDLILRARNGDRSAFADIVRMYQRKIYGVAARMTKRHEAADDIVQDTFIRAYRHLDRFELGRPLGPWLKKIAVNLSLNYLSASQRKEVPFETDERPDGPKWDRAAADEPDPFRQLQSLEFAEALERAVSALPVEQQAVLRLKVVEGMRYDEIAASLDISAGTVMSRLSRARAKLKASLKEHGSL